MGGGSGVADMPVSGPDHAPVLQLSGVTLRFAGRVAPVVEEVSLQVAAGEVLCLVGASGSGKSVTARACLRLEGHEGGRIAAGAIRLGKGETTVEMQDAPPDRLRALRGRQVAMIFQEPAASLNPVRRIGAQLEEGLRAKAGLGRAAARLRALALLARVGFPAPEAIQRAYPHQLSGGMCQRVMIAMALAGGPRVLVADEPTTALDAVAQAEVLALLDDLRRDMGLAILLITHDPGVVARMADRVAVMAGGRIVETGPASEMLRAPKTAAARDILAGSQTARYRAPPADDATAPVLAVRNLQVAYAGHATQAVRGVSLEIARGETLALVGQSGSGKTTLARAALRLIPLVAGRVLLDGDDITGLAGQALRRARARMQMIFQDPLLSLDPRRALGRQVADPLRNFGVPAPERAARVAALFERVGLDPDLMNRRLVEVSGGQRQRVAIARALVLDPRVIVADEALASLDPHMRERIAELLVSLQHERGLGCLFISHDIAAVARIAHRIAVMHEGRIVETGPARAVLETPGHGYTRSLIAAAGGGPVKSPLAPAPPDARLQEVSPGHMVLGTPDI